jgi:hypothetical protein
MVLGSRLRRDADRSVGILGYWGIMTAFNRHPLINLVNFYPLPITYPPSTFSICMLLLPFTSNMAFCSLCPPSQLPASAALAKN